MYNGAYLIHKMVYNNRIILRLRKYHLYHHYKNQFRNFGVLTKFWDIVFKTY